jgi:hypothetical protein
MHALAIVLRKPAKLPFCANVWEPTDSHIIYSAVGLAHAHHIESTRRCILALQAAYGANTALAASSTAAGDAWAACLAPDAAAAVAKLR